jgi:membrane-associated protease RseP (regulator of RpoE activity)
VGLSLFSSFGFSVACYALNPSFFESVVNNKDLTVLVTCIPVFAGVVAVQAVHELAHYLVAKARGIKIGLPVPVPSTLLGSFGSITPLRSFPPNQAAMIDFALSGPVAAMSLSLVLLVIGIFQTVYASEVALSRFPVVPVSMLRSSFLSGTLLTFFAPKTMMLPLSQPIPIHPLFMVGFSGLISSALNLLPMFRLDGGRACSAALGNRIGGFTSAGTLLFLLSLSLSGSSGLAFAWGLFVVFFQRRPEIPVRDEVTQIDDFRLGAWIASLTTAILALVPFPGGPWFL